MRRLWVAVSLCIMTAGCGLTLDLDPPDPTPFDGGRNDIDGGHADAAQGDGGPTCLGDLDCDDGEPCDGLERCVDGACTPGEPPTGAECTSSEGVVGICNLDGFCVPPSCGDGITDIEEACDDGNADPGDGCEADCTHTCTEDTDCEDGDVCNGIASCSIDRGCVLGEPLLCAASDLCHVAGCDPLAGCFEDAIDEDGDGHSPIVADAAMCGDDCDDSDVESWLGATERCDGDDDDCDGIIDEDVGSIVCRPDVDGDGFGSTTVSATACVCADGSTTIGGDCFDRPDPIAGEVNPDQDAFFSTPYCVDAGRCGFDYDCDGVTERRWEQRFSRCTFVLLASCVGSGYDVAVPACGAVGTWVECTVGLGPSGSLLCDATRSSRTQECR